MARSHRGQGAAQDAAAFGREQRVPLTASTTPKDFRDFYWLKIELQDFCRSQGLATSGGKREIADRIETFLRSGRRVEPTKTTASAEPSARLFNQMSAQQFSLRTRVPAGFKCTQEARRFFETNVSPRFRFTVTLQEYIKAHRGITFAEIGEQWKREYEARKAGTFKPAIAPQFEFNQFTRDFHADPRNAGKTRADCLKAWKRTRARRGDNTYRPEST
jgi:hypothetical protein